MTTNSNPKGDPQSDPEIARLSAKLAEAKKTGASTSMSGHSAKTAAGPGSPGQLNLLWLIAALGVVAAVILALSANSIGPFATFGGVSQSKLDMKVALAAWSDLFGLIGITAGIGGIVLSGVVAALRNQRPD